MRHLPALALVAFAVAVVVGAWASIQLGDVDWPGNPAQLIAVAVTGVALGLLAEAWPRTRDRQ